MLGGLLIAHLNTFVITVLFNSFTSFAFNFSWKLLTYLTSKQCLSNLITLTNENRMLHLPTEKLDSMQ